MKKLKILFGIVFLIIGPVSAQEVSVGQENNFEKVKGQYLGISEPIRNLSQKEGLEIDENEHDEGDVHKNRKRPEAVNENALPKGEDPIRQKTINKSGGVISLDVNFNGLNGAFPPDPSGAASEQYYVQAVNTRFKVYNKDGSTATDSAPLNTLWPGSANSGDPIVLWDRHAERFVITQFQTGSNEILFAVSTSEDPTDTYYLYRYEFPSFPDYPKYSVWSDGYYMTSNTSMQNVVAFERDKMIVGDSTAAMISLDLPYFQTHYGFRSVLPADADGDLPPYGTPINMFLFEDDSWDGVTEDRIKVLEMIVDWDIPSNSSINVKQEISTEPFNSVFTTSWNDISQKGTSQKLDAIASVFNYRAQYLKWPGYNTLMLCNVVDVDNEKTGGIRWYELRQDDDGEDWSIHQQSTFSPDDGASRFLGSIAMDYNGHIALAYSISGPDHYPGLALTGRFSSFELGKMELSETIAVEGGYYQSGGNRFGDYSQMTLDPDGETFWYTGEYIGDFGARRTRIFSFNLNDQLSAESQGEIKAPELNLNQDSDNIYIKGVNLPDDELMMVELFTLSGQLIANDKMKVFNGELSASFSKSKLQSGIYLVRVGKENFQRVKKLSVSK